MKKFLFVCKHYIKQLRKFKLNDEEICEELCPYTKKTCNNQPERLSEKTSKEDATV